jgi:hypothetical protein
MNEMEMELSRLLNVAAGEPPRHVTLQAVRRKVRMRRLVAGVCVTAVLGVGASVGLAVSAGAAWKHPAATPRHTQVSMPRYYFQGSFLGRPVTMRWTVRSVANGAIKASIRCPGSQPSASAAAAADNQTFFMTCSMTARPGTQIYRFVVSRSGQVSRLEPVRGGMLVGIRTENLATSADGSELATAVGPLGGGRISEVIVINTRTGAHAIWHSSRLGGGVAFSPYEMSFGDNGRELAVFGYTRCTTAPGGHRCRSPGEEMLAVNHAARGGRLASGQVIFTEAGFLKPLRSYFNDAFITADGHGVIAGGLGPSGVTVYQLAAAPGRQPRLISQFSPVGFDIYRLVSPDPSDRFLLYASLHKTGRQLKLTNGWLRQERVVPLKAAGDVFVEVW